MKPSSDPNETKRTIMKSREELHQELRQAILALAGVTERQNAGIHEDAFFVGSTMFMHIHGYGHCDIRLSKADQQRALAEGKARRHRWAPEAGYVTFVVNEGPDLRAAMELIRMSHNYFARSAPQALTASGGLVNAS
jgi:luciferase-like monooxygenase